MPKHIDQLERDVKVLGRSLGRLGDKRRLAELIRIIRRPGWTTPAELTFALGALRTLNGLAVTMDRGLSGLVGASAKVGRS